jgi:hypothetical protein
VGHVAGLFAVLLMFLAAVSLVQPSSLKGKRSGGAAEP